MTQRIDGIDPDDAEPRIKAVLDAQAAKWGAPLANHLVYARVPEIFRAVRGMWSGLEAARARRREVARIAQPACCRAQRLRVLTGLQRCSWQRLGDRRRQGRVGRSLDGTPDLFDEREQAALEYADAITSVRS